MTEETNPVEASVKYLVSAGYTRDDAMALLRALKARSGEALWEATPKWVEYCHRLKLEYETVISLAIAGMVAVEYDGDEQMISLTQEGLKFGKKLKKAEGFMTPNADRVQRHPARTGKTRIGFSYPGFSSEHGTQPRAQRAVYAGTRVRRRSRRALPMNGAHGQTIAPRRGLAVWHEAEPSF